MADGLLNALQGRGAIASIFLGLGVTLGCTLLCLAAAIWILHHQVAVTASI
jgi:hypothetical protein